ncbi:hypothetical protein ACS0TY_021326 [Phlomoides rotata]
MNSFPQYGISLFAFLSWNIWKARNCSQIEQKNQLPGVIIARSISGAEEFQDTITRDSQRKKHDGSPARWQRPPEGALKLNSGVATFSDSSVGFVFVLRNHEGTVLFAGSKCVLAAGKSSLLEALALRCALGRTISHGFQDLCLESDSQTLISALQDHLEADQQTMLIVEVIRETAQPFNSFNFCFVRREGNSAAHVLAHYAPEINVEKLWSIVIPECCGDDFGYKLKDTLVAQLRSFNIEVEDIGTSKYYSVGEEIGHHVSQASNTNSVIETRGLVACGTCVGVSIFSNNSLEST